MPLYYFVLKSNGEVIPGRDEIELPGIEAARKEAIAVARELMRNREPEARSWRLEVCDDYLVPTFEILFAEVDETIDHLLPPYRESIERVCRQSASLVDAFEEVRQSLLEVRETFARMDDILSATTEMSHGPDIRR